MTAKVAGWLAAACWLAAAPALASTKAAPASTVAMPASVRAHWQWVKSAGDHERSPFVIIDKPSARLWLFDADAQLRGQTPVLLGLSRGDASIQGIGERPLSTILPHERTTPAGRFIAEPGHNAAGEDIFWVDYDAAVSMHRVRATNPRERRLQRLATATAADNRISYGCINVPAAFYDRYLRPTLTVANGPAASRRPVVYLLPDTLPRESLFKSQPLRTAASVSRD